MALSDTAATLYHCADGTPFPVRWERETDQAETWRWNQDHFPNPMPPLEMALDPPFRDGYMRAFEEADVPIARRDWPLPQGFQYAPAVFMRPEDQTVLEAGAARLVARYGSLLGIWEQHCVPRIRLAARALQIADDRAPLAELAELRGYMIGLTFVAGRSTAVRWQPFNEFCLEAFGQDGSLLALELTQGGANATLDADEALWRLARTARAEATVCRVILDMAPAEVETALGSVPTARAFLDEFRSFLDHYGLRAERWGLEAPTWRERPETPLGLVRTIIQRDAPSPIETARAATARRDDVLRATRARLAPDADKLARFEALLEPLTSYVTIRENRAYWQLIATGSLRTALLRRGRGLVEQGQIAAPEDVFFLLPDEVVAAPAGGANDALGERVAERRAEWQWWAARTPPLLIGAGAETAPPAGSPPLSVLRGMPASRGVVTARARVLAGIEDGDRLGTGEVLVCVMTAPPWTPLFSIAGAVVTDSGSILSHPAIAAREYGIPCVVAARGATATIRDGALVTVDGGLGTVQIHDETGA